MVGLTFCPPYLRWTIRPFSVPDQPVGSGLRLPICVSRAVMPHNKLWRLTGLVPTAVRSKEKHHLCVWYMSIGYVFPSKHHLRPPSSRWALAGGVCGRRSQRRGFHGGHDKKPGPGTHRGHDKQPEAQRLGLLRPRSRFSLGENKSFIKLRFKLRLDSVQRVSVLCSLKEWHARTLKSIWVNWHCLMIQSSKATSAWGITSQTLHWYLGGMKEGAEWQFNALTAFQMLFFLCRRSTALITLLSVYPGLACGQTGGGSDSAVCFTSTLIWPSQRQRDGWQRNTNMLTQSANDSPFLWFCKFKSQ